MDRRQSISLGGGLLIALFFFCWSAIGWLSTTNLLRHGVTAQGAIVGKQTISCGKTGTKNIFSVQFTDRTGQGHTSTISQCSYSFDASSGDSVTIVYLPNNPTQIAPPDQLMSMVQFSLNSTIFSGLITLILLPFWMRKRMRKPER